MLEFAVEGIGLFSGLPIFASRTVGYLLEYQLFCSLLINGTSNLMLEEFFWALIINDNAFLEKKTKQKK